MIFAKLLKLRDKLTNKRKNLHADEEKPFLEHLEDLRKMLMKITITLLIALFGSMVWYKEFFDVVKLPAKWAGLALVEDKNKPEDFDNKRWEKVKETARAVSSLPETQRTAYYAALNDPKLRVEAEAMLIYKVSWNFAQTLDKDGGKRELLPDSAEVIQRDKFIEAATANDPEVKAAVKVLVARATRPDIEAAKPVIELVWRKPAESFFTAMKLALYAGLIVAFPLIFYFLLEFVMPGLTDREKKLLWPALAIGFGLFLAGVFLAFFFVVPNTLQFFHVFGNDIDGTRDQWTVADYVTFVTTFSLIFGASFELPVVVLVLVKLGLLTSEFMRRTRAWAIVIIVVVAAIITPTGDPGTLASLALPMIVMYEACIWIAVWLERKERAREAADEAESRQRYADSRLILPVDGNPDDSHDSPDHPTMPPEPVLHPEIVPYRNPHEDAYHDHDYHNSQYHDSGTDHDAWLKEQEELYRKEHAHLFEDLAAMPQETESLPEASTASEPNVEPSVEASAEEPIVEPAVEPAVEPIIEPKPPGAPADDKPKSE
jgi:sec-independent protein translocase protein TatC